MPQMPAIGTRKLTVAGIVYVLRVVATQPFTIQAIVGLPVNQNQMCESNLANEM